MDQKKENAKVYKSPSTGQLCDSAQYIAELMCYRRAEKDQIAGLEYKFWNKSMKDTYKAQVVSARRLIAQFGEKSVIYYLNQNKNIYSLGHYRSPKFIIDGIAKVKLKNIDIQPEADVDKLVEDQVAPARRKPQVKSNLFTSIKKAENINGKS